MFRSVDALLRPRTIAIVGATDRGGDGWSKAIYDNLAHCGFPAKVYLVNPRREELWGERVYPNFASIPEPVDLALTIIPAPFIPETLTEAAAHGLKSALIYAARFGEGGDAEGAERARIVRALCQEKGLRVSGPNCMGLVALRERLLLYPASRVRALPAGPVGVVFQSGGTFQFWLQHAATRGLGFSYAVSSGNELDLDLADYINFLVEDEHTRIIACMVEGVRRPAAFMAAAEKALAARKPLLVVKLGRSERGRAAAASHTGALAGDDAVFDAVCRKYGVLRCPALDDLIEGCLAFGQGRLPKGRSIAIAGYSGGAKGLLLDYAAEQGAALAALAPETAAALAPRIDPGLPAENPLDVGATTGVQAKKFAEICRIMAGDPHVDLFIIQGQLPYAEAEPYSPEPFLEVMAATDKPVIAYGRTAQNVTDAGRAFQAKVGVPFIQGLPETIRAAQALVRYAEALRAGVMPLPAPRGTAAALEGEAFHRLLGAHGLTPPRSAVAPTPDEAARRAAALGFPVAVKIQSPQAAHKTEVGGVALHLGDADAVRAAAEAMARRLAAADPGARLDGFLVQEMVDGVELIVGVREDPLYGPFMLAGLGGVMVEALRDVAIRLLPVDEAMAREMLGSLKGGALLGAFRGRPARDLAATARAMAGLSRLFLDHRPFLADLEINPLIALAEGEGVRAVDVRAVRR
ncbi:MAG TPA: acetate--CoA ligase family protein [Stellaceae bacterium]|nr:acetate--CoA ligase family protein [Stellaceae bacterium]